MIPAIAKQAAHPKILVPFIVLTAYVAALVFVGWLVGVWNSLMVKGTVVWFVGSALALLFNIEKVWGESTFFRGKALSLLAPTVFVEYFVNLFVLSFFAELILQPVLAVLLMLSFVAGKDSQYRLARKFSDGLLALAGISAITCTVVQLIRFWDHHDGPTLVLNFALPIWLSIGFLPFIYVMAAYAAYESSFIRIDFFLSESESSSRRRVKLALLTTLRGSFRHVVGFVGYWVTEADSAGSFAATREVISRFLASKREEEAALKEEQTRLVKYAGIVGADSARRQLDRREFNETTDSLHWLAVCHMGWYNRNGKYRNDLIEILGYSFHEKGLPDVHGITMHVAEDGQAWWAWRRTITGWCFAVGAAGPPPDEWEFDGPEPPDGFPGQDPRWGDEPFSLDFNRNWLIG